MTVVSGDRRFAAPPERVFAALTDPNVIAQALPGVRSHRVIDDDHWEAKVKPPLPLFPAVTVRMEVIDRKPPTHAGVRAKSRGIDITSTFDLSPDGDGTLMQWSTDVHVAGGGHGLEGVARHQAERTLDAVERSL
jgi:carbon monoxide dehydrogenase subunit G